MTAKSDRIVPILIAALLALGTGAMWGAKAPMGAEKMRQEAKLVLSGKVLEVSSKVQKSTVERAAGDHRDRVYTIRVLVQTVTKGSEVKAGTEILVMAWKPVRRMPPYPGLQGHESIPEKGEVVTFYLQGKAGKWYEPLLPNGMVVEKAEE